MTDQTPGELELPNMGPGLKRIITTKARDFGNDDGEDLRDAWVFPVGTKHGFKEDERFLNNSIMTAKYTCLNFIPKNFLH